MSETSDDLVMALGMDEEERELAEMMYAAIQAASAGSERSQQAAEFKVGVSDLGFCSERTKRMLEGEVPSEEADLLLAWIGTALGDHAERAFATVFPKAIFQAEVTLPLEGQGGQVYQIPGHPDIVEPERGLLIDVKTDYGLTTIERTGPSRQQQFQRHGYAKAAWLAGLFGDRPLEEVRVGNVWIDRSGIEKRLHVQVEPFDPVIVAEAAEWLDEVIYAYLETAAGRHTDAAKEPPREMCAVVCGFYETCRALDTDVSGLLTDQTVLAAMAMYVEGMEAEKAGRKLKDEAKQHLQGISGSTGTHMIRWVHVNESVTKPSVRGAYDKIDIKPIKKPGR